jgi:hypothetical protein
MTTHNAETERVERSATKKTGVRKNGTIESDLKALVMSPEVQAIMRADHVKPHELLANLSAISVVRRRNVDVDSTVAFHRALRRLGNMSEMMDRLGFDAETLAGTQLNIDPVFRACQACPTAEICHNWLAGAPKSLTRAPPFCSNAERFARAKVIIA